MDLAESPTVQTMVHKGVITLQKQTHINTNAKRQIRGYFYQQHLQFQKSHKQPKCLLITTQIYKSEHP